MDSKIEGAVQDAIAIIKKRLMDYADAVNAGHAQGGGREFARRIDGAFYDFNELLALPPVAGKGKIEPVAWTSRANLKVAKQEEPFYAAVMGSKNTPEMNVALYTGEQLSAALAAAEQRGRESERERCAKLCDAVRIRMMAGRKRPLPQIEEYGAGIADNIAADIRKGE